MRSPALLLLAASLVALPAAAEPPPAAAPAPAPVPAPAPAPAPVPAIPPPVGAPYAAPVYVGPPWWAIPPRVMERRSKGLLATGIVLWGVGAIVSGVGAGIFIPAATQTCEVAFGAGGPPPPLKRARPRARSAGGERIGTARQAFGGGCGNDDQLNLGMALLSGGLLGSFLGIPLFVVGNTKVPAHPRDALVPGLRVGAGSADLRWAF